MLLVNENFHNNFFKLGVGRQVDNLSSDAIYHLITTFIFLSGAFYPGAKIEGNNTLIALSLFLISFILGKAKEYGVELERLLLFMASKRQTFKKIITQKQSTRFAFIFASTTTLGLILFVLIAAYFAPLGLIRNYWLGNIFIAALILFLLEISSTQHTESLNLAASGHWQIIPIFFTTKKLNLFYN